jgi:HK97 family phage portal protein
MVQLWPPVDVPSTLTRQVWDSDTARMIPGVGRALALYRMLGQAPLDVFRGILPLERPRLLERPDPLRTRPSFVKAHVEDYLLNGNAVHLITSWRSDGTPGSCRWYPAHMWGLVEEDGDVGYFLNGRRVVNAQRDVVHVRRGADPAFPGRGVGVVEQHMRALNKIGLQDAAEGENLRGRGTPTVAIIVPQKEPKEPELDAAADKWQEKYSTTQTGQPAFLPNGTQVVPLAWSPSDQQMTEARRLGLTDVANMFNLDGYWLGAPVASHTYRSPGPMFLQLIRTSLDDVATELEDEWSERWTVRGQRIRFDRNSLLADDMQTAVTTAAAAVAGRLWTIPEARDYVGRDPSIIPEPITPPPVLAPPAPDPEPAPTPTPVPEG